MTWAVDGIYDSDNELLGSMPTSSAYRTVEQRRHARPARGEVRVRRTRERVLRPQHSVLRFVEVENRVERLDLKIDLRMWSNR